MRSATRFGLLLVLLSGCDASAPPVDPPPVDPVDPPPDLPGAGEAWVLPSRPVPPLRVAASGRTLVDRDGTPVLLHGDAAWSAIVNLREDEMARYLADRRRKGFNALYVNLIETVFSDQEPGWRNVNGDDPFLGTVDGYVMDFSAPNEPYWAHVDAFLDKADAAGFVVIAFPAYTGWQHGFDGWAFFLHSNGVGRVRAYGEFLGRRYADRPNLIWAAGGDWGPTGRYDLVDEYAALTAGIRAHDATHLWTAHGGQESGVDVYGYLGLDLNTTYRYPPASVPEAVSADYARTPATPFVFFEGWYENEYDVSVAALRYQAYTSLLGGAAGQFYGNNPVWKFGAGWEDALDDPGALDMVHVGDLFRSRPFHRLVPDRGNAVVTSNRGRQNDGTYVAAARVSDGSTVIVYVPDQRAVEVDLGRVAGAEARAWCVDPKTGEPTDLGRVEAAGRATFRPCASPDWVLVLDDASLGLPPPGRR